MTRSALAGLVFISAMVVPGIAVAARTIRIDKPGVTCELLRWGAVGDDPYVFLDGNSNGEQNLSAFFSAGTVTTGDPVSICLPIHTLASIWSSTSANYDPKQAANPASNPNEAGAPTIPSLTATGAVLYEWANYSSAVNDPPAADAVVIVWTLLPSATLPTGAYEIELDNWCGPSPAEAIDPSTQVGPAASSSLTWAGNVYIAKCANFGTNGSASDLLMSPSGTLIGYVDSSNATHVTSSVPGWQTPASVNMTPVDNVFGIGTLGVATTGGGLDGSGSSYAGNLLGSSVTWSGVNFQFPSAGANSAASEAVVPLPAGAYSTLKLLGTGVNGSHPNHTFIVTYTDGTQSTFTQSLSNWSTPQNFAGESIVTTMPYKLLADGTEHAGSYNLYGYSFALNSAKTPKTLTLPSNRDVIALAVDLVP